MKNLLHNNDIPAKGNLRINRKVVTFLLCLLIAVLFWMLNAMSKYYNDTIPIPVRYFNLPKSKVISNDLPNTINGLIKARGYRLLSYVLKPFNDTLQFDVTSYMMIGNDSISYIVTSQITEKLSQQIKGNIKLLEIEPDTIFLFFSKSISKKVPVKPRVNIKFNEQYRLADKLTCIPDSILISGDANTIKNINHLETEEINLNEVSKNINTTAHIVINKNQKIKVSQQQIKLSAAVAKFTERSIDVPIVIKNIPKGVSLRLFPEKATVKFLLPLDAYEKTTETMFKAEVDASEILKSADSKLKIVLVQHPEWTENISISPAKAEFIIKK